MAPGFTWIQTEEGGLIGTVISAQLAVAEIYLYGEYLISFQPEDT